MRGTVVAILRGGPAPHHELSLSTGHALLNALTPEHFTVRDIYIDPEEVWHERGIPTAAMRVLRSSDAVLSALHGPFGENGKMQRLFEQSGIPYNGADSYASYAALHNLLAKRHAEESGILTPRFAYIEPGMDISQIANEINRTFPQPVIVKPVANRASAGRSLPHGFAPIRAALADILETGSSALVEERVRGTEASVGLIEGMRGEALYALPPIELLASGQPVAPARFTREVTDALIAAARQMHQALGLRHYSRTDFIVSPRGLYFVEMSSLPPLGTGAVFAQGLSSVGITLPEFAEHVVAQTLSHA